MATIEEKLKNVRTLEDIVYLLTILFTNLNNQNKMYYDMFLNPTPMDIELERYDENGKLVTVTLANRAKDRIFVLSGEGSPNGKVAATVGTIYIDLTSQDRDLYYKGTGSDTSTDGWILIYSQANLGGKYLAPDGDASNLQHIDANSIDRGVLEVSRGGTGTSRITAGRLVQGNEQDPFTSYNISNITSLLDEFIGMIMWCPLGSISGNWLICDGTEYNINTDPHLVPLFNKIGNKYGGDGTSTFKVPDLIDRYVKGGTLEDVGTFEEGHLLKHSHGLEGNVNSESSHVHPGGSLNVPNSYARFAIRRAGEASGAFTFTEWTSQRGDTYSDGNNYSRQLNFDTANKWSGTSGAGSSHTHSLEGLSTKEVGSNKNEVDHIIMVPVIRY